MNILRSIYNVFNSIDETIINQRIDDLFAEHDTYFNFWLNMKVWWLGKDIQDLKEKSDLNFQKNFVNLCYQIDKVQSIWEETYEMTVNFHQNITKEQKKLIPLHQVALTKENGIEISTFIYKDEKPKETTPFEIIPPSVLPPSDKNPKEKTIVETPPAPMALPEPPMLEEIKKEDLVNEEISTLCDKKAKEILTKFPDINGQTDIESSLSKLIHLNIEFKIYTQEKKSQFIFSVKEKIVKEKALLTHHLKTLGKEDLNEELNHQLTVEGASLFKPILEIKQKEFIFNCRKGKKLPPVNTDAFEELHRACVKEATTIDRINTQLQTFLKFSKLKSPYKEMYQITVSHSGNQDRPLNIKVTHPLLGYSMDELLSSIELIKKEDYNGEVINWNLALEDANRLNEHLSNVMRWQDDFNTIVGEMLGNEDESQNYITLGRKPLSEIIKNPLRLTPDFVERLKNIKDVQLPCLLFKQVSINLNEYPAIDAFDPILGEESINKKRLAERQYIKNLFESFYTLEGMIGADKKPKKFIIDDPWCSVLNITQLEEICPHLNKQLKFKQIVTEFTGRKFFCEAVEVMKCEMEMPNELLTFRAYKAEILRDAFQKIPEAKFGLESHISHLLDYFKSIPTVNSLEEVCMGFYDNLLTKFSGPYFKQQEKFYSPTESEMNALYPKGRDRNERGVFMSKKNIDQLFDCLKKQPAFSAKEAQESLDKFRESWLLRLTGGKKNGFELVPYHSLTKGSFYYGPEHLDAALIAFEAYVSKIVYKSKTKITDESIAESIIQIEGTGDDVLFGCSNGFCGRIENIGSALIYGNQSPFQNHMNKIINDCVNEAFEAYALTDEHSSHQGHEKKKVLEYLMNYKDEPAFSYANFSPVAKKILYHFSLLYTPKKVYYEAYKFFTNSFWDLSQKRDDEKIYSLLDTLAFEGEREDLDRRYRAFGSEVNRWQYTYFQQDIPKYLIKFLIKGEHLFSKEESPWKYKRATEFSAVTPQTFAISAFQQTKMKNLTEELKKDATDVKKPRELGVLAADKKALEQTGGS